MTLVHRPPPQPHYAAMSTPTAPDHPALSVVVAAMGGARLAETVASVAASAAAADSRVETIVVWQGPGEALPAEAPARVVRCLPLGLAHARNRGTQAARSELVAYVDEDEVVDPLWIAGLLEAFEHNARPAGVFGQIEPLDDAGLPYCRREGVEPRVLSGARTPPWVVGSGGNMAFRREALRRVGDFDSTFGAGSVGRSAEESELIVRLLHAGETVVWTPHAVVYHPTKTETERLAARFPYAYGLGRVVRRHRDLPLGARYAKSLGGALLSAARSRDRRRLREWPRTLSGFVAGAVGRPTPLPSVRLLELAPGEVRAAFRGTTPTPRSLVFTPDAHAILETESLLLHVYQPASPRRRDALAARSEIRARTGLDGIPRVLASGEAQDALWVVEERLLGRQPAGAASEEWLPRVLDWAVRLAGEPGPPLAETDWWEQKREVLAAQAPPRLHEAAEAAIAALERLPVRHGHGDLQRKNLLLGAGGVGVVDWEYARTEAIPGTDLLLLAATARTDVPDGALLDRLAAGGGTDLQPLRSALASVGITQELVRPHVLVTLLLWAGHESERLRADPSGGHRRIFGALLDDALNRAGSAFEAATAP
jgi:hypothetical protein